MKFGRRIFSEKEVDARIAELEEEGQLEVRGRTWDSFLDLLAYKKFCETEAKAAWDKYTEWNAKQDNAEFWSDMLGG